ncbi:MAG: PEP-CTERM sorting domain-containing protein [Phycisphaerales bacterium]|nr:MAG: PEP-CTERM sorting domain-containing protein [Phycisphaerales bacterium]
MMRKLFVSILVLGLVPAVNAALIQVDGQAGDAFDVLENSVITVVGEDISSWLGYVIVDEGSAGALSDAVALDGAGNLASASPYSEAGWGTGYELTVAMAPGGVPAIAVGPQFSMNFAGALGDTARISLFVDPEFAVPVSSVLLTVVPEPMTILLLGLGGLFLRRRK